MLRFLGCMILGLAAFIGYLLFALLIDWSKFRDVGLSDLKDLWDISIGKE